VKYEEYIKKLDNLNEEFEEGLLLGLQEKPPTNLHGEIIKSINRERKKVNFFNYRIYAPAVAAILVFSVIINRPEILEKINFIKNAKITQEQNLTIANNADSGNNLKYNNIEKSVEPKTADTAVNTPEKPGVDSTTPDNNIKIVQPDINSAGQKDPELNVNGNNTAKQSNDNNPKIAAQDTPTKAETPPVKGNTVTDKNDSEEKSLSIGNLLGMIFFKEPEINYEIVLDTNKSDVLNFITENHIQKLNTPNTYKLSLEQFDNLDKLLTQNNVRKYVVSEDDANTDKVVKIDLVNYHILIDDSEANIVKFIEDQEKCVRISDNTYKITTSNMNELNKLLSSSGIKKDSISEVEDDYVFIKALIINYEVSIDAGQTEVINFIKNTEKCKSIQDGIYKISKDNLSQFKELLANSMIEFKVLNETNNQEVYIKVNN
jgi:hypothetical protein